MFKYLITQKVFILVGEAIHGYQAIHGWPGSAVGPEHMAKEAAAGQIYGVPDQVRWQASLPHLARRATERRSEATSQWVRDHVRPERRYPPPWRPRFPKGGAAEGTQVYRPALLSAAVRTHGDWSLSPRADDRPPEVGNERLLVVRPWETDATPLFHGMQCVGPPDQGAVAESGKGLRVGAPEGASAEVAVEGRRRRGGGRVFGECEGEGSSVGRGGRGRGG